MGEEELDKQGTQIDSRRECILGIGNGGDEDVSHFYEPGAFESGSPTRDLSAGCAWGHTAQEEMVVRMSEA